MTLTDLSNLATLAGLGVSLVALGVAIAANRKASQAINVAGSIQHFGGGGGAGGGGGGGGGGQFGGAGGPGGSITYGDGTTVQNHSGSGSNVGSVTR